MILWQYLIFYWFKLQISQPNLRLPNLIIMTKRVIGNKIDLQVLSTNDSLFQLHFLLRFTGRRKPKKSSLEMFY